MSHLCTRISLRAFHQLINVDVVCYGRLAEQYLEYLSSCWVIWQADIDLPVQSTRSFQCLQNGTADHTVSLSLSGNSRTLIWGCHPHINVEVMVQRQQMLQNSSVVSLVRMHQLPPERARKQQNYAQTKSRKPPILNWRCQLKEMLSCTMVVKWWTSPSPLIFFLCVFLSFSTRKQKLAASRF